MELNLPEVDHYVVEWLSHLSVARAVTADCPDTNPVISDTSIPIHVIAALTRGQSAAEIIEDYPDLTPERIDAAVEYAKVYPKTGRPLPTRSFKRMLSDMAESGVWDVEATVSLPITFSTETPVE
jgi:hypothetical protein